MSQDKIKVIVGKENMVTFEVGRALLEELSPWFRVVLNPTTGFQEAITKTVKLFDYKPVAFKHCKQWIKHSILEPGTKSTWKELAMTWVLSEHLRMVEFGDEVIKTIVNRHWQGIRERDGNQDPQVWAAGVSNVSVSTMQYIYDNTTPSSVLRKPFVYLFYRP